MCEWAYVIDFDTDKLEVYKGFNKTPLSESDRFHFLPLREKSGDTQYYQVRIVASFDLKNLPTQEEFETICNPSPNEEEEEISDAVQDTTT